MTDLRSTVLWVGTMPDADVLREFGHRDLVVQPTGQERLRAGHLGDVAATVFSCDAEHGSAEVVKARAADLLDQGCAVLVTAVDESSLTSFARRVSDFHLRDRLVPFLAPRAHQVAEQVARSREECLPSVPVHVATAGNQRPLLGSDAHLFRRGFRDCSRAALVELAGGRSDTRVFAAHVTVTGSRAGRRPQPMFAKVGPHGKIYREFLGYREFADRYIPFGNRPNVRELVRGANRSLLVGDFVDRSESLWDLARRGVAGQAITSLMGETLSGWRDQGYSAEPYEGSVAVALARGGVFDIGKFKRSYLDLAGDVEAVDAVWARLASIQEQTYRVAPMHGDLHGENVRVRNGQAILIDLASVQADGPLTADVAALETWLAFERPPDDAEGEYENVTWRDEVDRLYAPAAFSHPPGPGEPTSPYHWMTLVVRQLRQIGIASQSCTTEYQTAVAVHLLRRCQWDDGVEADVYRRAHAYRTAARLAEDLVTRERR